MNIFFSTGLTRTTRLELTGYSFVISDIVVTLTDLKRGARFQFDGTLLVVPILIILFLIESW